MLLQFTAGSFSAQPSEINERVKSLMLLEVYDSNDDCIATASGFVAFNNRTLVTNYHVIEDADVIQAYSDDGDVYLVTGVYCADENADIAILSFFSPTDIAPLALDRDEDLLRAEPVVAIGSPQGIKNVVSIGNVSAIYSEEGVDYIQFTAPVSSGSSGGALFNEDGNVVGVTSAIYDDDTSLSQNLNFAVDIDMVIDLYETEALDKPVSFSEFFGGYASEPTDRPAPKPSAKPYDGSSAFRTAYMGAAGKDIKDIQDRLYDLGYQLTQSDGRLNGMTLMSYTYFALQNVVAYESYTGDRFDGVFEFLTPADQEFLFDDDAMPYDKEVFGDGLGTLVFSDDINAEYYNVSGDILQIKFKVTNTSASETVTNFVLLVYAEDKNGHAVGDDGYGLYILDTNKRIRPGASSFSDFVYLQGRSNIDRVYCQIFSTDYASGESLVLNGDALDYISYWTGPW